MKSAVDVNIYSTRPYFGKLLVIYKKLISFFLKPYLRIVIEEQNKIILDKMSLIESKLVNEISMLTNSYNQHLNQFVEDILKRTDIIIMEIDKKVEADRVKLNEIMCLKNEVDGIRMGIEKLSENHIALKKQLNEITIEIQKKL
ncbi:MAG: hypothetical protein COS89_09640 [Deltaproteobacteria bacterium CG07_land_8_20_14_0_80_38_7]|nr:MAG: hypothetical protein COS89_09640 [Deltaproteobacteria bacterium CG07_land_8_20_14_0_80_38_7]